MKRMQKLPNYSAQLEGVANSSVGIEAEIIEKHIISVVPVASVVAEPSTHRADGEVVVKDHG